MPLRVHIAGHNVDVNALSEIQEILNSILREAGSAEHWSDIELRRFIAELYRASEESISKQALTPEVLSAAYARISRDPKSIPELRRAAREGISRARKSNEMIIFGLGHASVSEHAAFNFDVLDLSRLAAEELQSHRLLSFTEKSQRYITASDDYVLPEELKETKWEKRFPSEIKSRFEDYGEFFRILFDRIVSEEGEASDKKVRTEQETRAKEDARYLLPLATTTQMGMSLNARSLEYVLRDCAGHELAEMRQLGQKLCEVARSLAPSLIKYIEARSFPRQNRSCIAQDYPVQIHSKQAPMLTAPQVSFISASEHGEQVIADAIAFHTGTQLEAENVSPKFWQEILRGMTEHDAAPREFELATLQFQVKVSACCYGQLKRHRMATLLPAPYHPDDGFILPPAVAEAGLADKFEQAVRQASHAARELATEIPAVAPYILTNAHIRRIQLQVNARELYHIARLRQDKHAQWEIRQVADLMVAEARRLWPNLMALACGKDTFEECYQQLFWSE